MQISYELTPDDLASYSKEMAPQNKPQHYFLVAFYAGLMLLFLFSDMLFAFFVSYEGKPLHFFARFGIAAAILAIFYLTAMTISKYSARKAQKTPGPNGLFCEHTITFASDGFTEETHVNRCFHTWSSIEKVAESKNFVSIQLRLGYPYAIPKRIFSEESQAKTFISTVEKHIESSRIPPPPAFS